MTEKIALCMDRFFKIIMTDDFIAMTLWIRTEDGTEIFNGLFPCEAVETWDTIVDIDFMNMSITFDCKNMEYDDETDCYTVRYEGLIYEIMF